LFRAFSLLSAWKCGLKREKSKNRVVDVGPRASLVPVQISIRPARPTDVDIVLGILDEAATWLQEHKIPSVWTPGGFSRQSFLDQISRGEVYIALVDDLTVGTFILQWTDSLFWGERPPDAGYVHKLAIRPVSSGKGIGLEMLKWAEAQAKSAGKRFLRLNCLAVDRKIRDYYERAGFVNRGDVVEPRGRASLYEKRLSP